ncbi:hypothetical protein PFISCL1PPCAC_12683, partial [Pristionchus fissidentatus]
FLLSSLLSFSLGRSFLWFPCPIVSSKVQSPLLDPSLSGRLDETAFFGIRSIPRQRLRTTRAATVQLESPPSTSLPLPSAGLSSSSSH